jgi:hypothetical protein
MMRLWAEPKSNSSKLLPGGGFGAPVGLRRTPNEVARMF